MRKLIHTLIAGALAFSLAAPALADPPRHANARGYDRGHDRDYRDNRRRDDRRYESRKGDHRRYDKQRRYSDNRDHHRDKRWRDDRRYTNYRYAPPVYVAPRYTPPAYYAPRRHAWRPGGYLPHNTRYHVINDYRRYRLAPPRHGHYYADVDGDILLVAAATGLIVWALNN